MRSVLALSLFAIAVSSIACLPERPALDQEGLEAGECSDEADNDADGLYDCDDPDCHASPACSESDVDADADADADVDDDGDGYSENQGDCDDGDAGIHPNTTDLCNGVDDDCDGLTDEDSVLDDAWEPNDTSASDLGELIEGSPFSVTAILDNDEDVDRYGFYIDDLTLEDWSFEVFTITITLSGIPADSTYLLTLDRVTNDTGEIDPGEISSEFGSTSVSLEFEESDGVDDSGFFEVRVESVQGADCSSSYLLSLERSS